MRTRWHKFSLFIGLSVLAVVALNILSPMGPHVITPAGSQEKSQDSEQKNAATATFGSGCFWCTEADFDKVDGVLETTSGYMGGTTPNPTYREVSSGTTGHIEVLRVVYDPTKVTYEKLLDHYWRTTDIVDGGGQFCDRGPQYRPVIFAHSDSQLDLAKKGKSAIDESKRFKKKVAVEIIPANDLAFTAAEKYHQDYYLKNPVRYKVYRYSCGRDARLKRLWQPVTN